ncbi:MAG: DUF456 domain-containing protein [Candidatus Doudnabacteria bacterium]|nr:DUF456 domain-containing protein [Candidatus Doudnabacteria bacterium]
MLNQIGLFLMTLTLLVAGLVGVILPFLPDVPLAWLGLFIYSAATGFEVITWQWLVFWGVLALFAFVLDFLGPAVGTMGSGKKASKWAIIGAILGTIGGIIVFGPLGILIGPLVGAFVGEYMVERNYKEALLKSYGAFKGYVTAVLIKVTIVLAMLVYFFVVLARG